ncbi:SDR family oxidoreductase [Lysinibacillus endophyticus]|uniref:SDR family NAD(P)-dependent oxidoreductase n=1 Tax=Ureibacillus endophyticus TaxID=1978490 RepID=UPI0020A1E190|nr:SDR family oxidoreductase [Lysinibacillus endophyticus]MCP1146744.1 SDR family oxidoreductase [Lysinibacillus endophyticus]
MSQHLFDLQNQNMIITGGAQGIGFEFVKAFKESGANIVVLDISDKVENLQELNVDYIQCDLMEIEKIEATFQKAKDMLNGRLDILINCAGIIKRSPAVDVPLDTWQRIFSLNVTSLFELSRLAAGVMKEQGRGKIINLSSIVSVIGAYNSSPYSASKGAVLQLTKSLSNEWASYGIQVNAIAPGYILTDMNTDILNNPTRKAEFEKRIPANRWGNPQDIVGTALFLASPASDYVTGVLIPVDGGVLSR